jgi:pimeloyl-ACP methyl ester carboxylesterase
VEPTWHALRRNGVRLACADYGGAGPVAVLLHGLAGHGREWDETASWLTASHRVLAPDARGHGGSEHRPGDVSRAAHVADVEAWLAWFEIERAALIGHSLGGHTAFLVAARRPDLAAALVVAESTPDPGPHFPEAVRASLARWPVPFPSLEAATEFFGGDSLRARAWASGLGTVPGGLGPRFDPEVMVASLHEVAERSFWADWAAVGCPALVVRAVDGVPRRAALRMVSEGRRAVLVEISGAGHDVHLDNPAGWRAELERFLLGAVSV